MSGRVLVVQVLRSYGPDVDFFCDYAPVGVVVVRADNMQVLYVFLDYVIDFAFPEHMVVSMMGEGTACLGRLFRVTGTEGIVVFALVIFVHTSVEIVFEREFFNAMSILRLNF